jgi:hypothetical protein
MTDVYLPSNACQTGDYQNFSPTLNRGSLKSPLSVPWPYCTIWLGKVPPNEGMCGFSQGDFLQGVVLHSQAVFWIIPPPTGAISGHFQSRYDLK